MRIFVGVLVGIPGLIVLLLLLPVRIRVSWQAELHVRAGLGPVMLTVFPAKAPKKAKKEKKKRTKPAKKPSDSAKTPAKKPGFRLAKITPQFALELVKIAKQALGRMLRAVKISRFKLHAVVAHSDPGSAALAYGRACAAVYAIASILDKNVNWRKSNVFVEVDFGGESRFSVETEIRAMPLLLVIAGLRGYLNFSAANKHALKLESGVCEKEMEKAGRQ